MRYAIIDVADTLVYSTHEADVSDWTRLVG